MMRFFGDNLTCFRGERVVFGGLSFAVEAGQALVLRGPNGSGKSSLLRMMAGLLQPFTGAVQWHDGPIGDEPDQHHSRLHYVGHADAVKPVLTVSENIGFWAALRTTSPNVSAALSAFGISGLADVPGRFLSAGQKRRVNLARILAAPATLWLLDEPATALDANAITALQSAIAQHRADGGMVIASTHQDLNLANASYLELGQFQADDFAEEEDDDE